MNKRPSEENIIPLIKMALEEDIKNGDVTSEAIFTGSEKSHAYIMAKEDGVFCGEDMPEMIFNLVDSTVEVEILVNDGSPVKTGQRVMNITGSTKSILTAERTILNFIQRMSGIATHTSRVVNLVKDTDIKILDTRKTLPGFRMLDKYSVLMGGGNNHRIGLFDMVMIKDNHIKAAGTIAKAVKKVRDKWENRYKIEVETTNLQEVEEAVESGADIIMLDNMDKETMKEAITIINKRSEIELSGNMTEEKIKNLRDLHIDFISIGGLTHSVEAFDLSMKFLD